MNVAARHRESTADTAVDAIDFVLPPELIAQHPAESREDARLMHVPLDSLEREHRKVSELPEYLRSGDLLVINDTRVIPARLRGTIGQAKAELLLLHPQASAPAEPERWLCLGKPGRRLVPGAVFQVDGEPTAVVVDSPSPSRYRVEFTGKESVSDLLSRSGEIPLPPYIRRPDGPDPADRERYQTIFARHPGAVAAPTAGLHFTEALLERVRQRDVEVASLTLHVGPGTFLPIRTTHIADHVMDPEWFEIPEATVAAIRRTKAAGGRVIAIGTTTTRALESAGRTGLTGLNGAIQGWADLFIVPGHRFTVIDALFTNFHLPGSTLLLLVAALAGRERVLDAYRDAVALGYRFYSYGDAMFLS